jgi:translocation and assembly module TamA
MPPLQTDSQIRLFCLRLLALTAFGLALMLPARANVIVDVRGLPEEIEANVLVYLSLERYKTSDNLTADVIERLQNRIEREVRAALRPFGYYEPTIRSEVKATTAAGRIDWRVTISVDTGQPVRVRAFNVKVTGPGGEDPVFTRLTNNPPLASGERLSHSNYETLKGGLQRAAATYGYLDARMVRSEMLVDPPNRSADITIEFDTGARYRFGATNITQDVIDDALARRFMRYAQDEAFDATDLLRTQFALDDSQYFSSVEVVPGERDTVEHVVPIEIKAQANRRNRYSYGVGYGTDTEARGTIGWDNRRVNRRGHRTRMEIKAASDTQSLDSRYIVPIGDPATEKFSLELKWEKERRGDLDTRSLDFQSGITHVRGSWQRVLFGIVSRTRSPDVQVFDPVRGGNPVVEQTLLIPAISYAAVPRGYLGEALFSRTFYAELRGSFQTLGSDESFVQLRAQAERVFNLGESWHVVTRGELGVTSVGKLSELPASQRFFAGGDRSVRGFGFNDLAPLEPVINAATNQQLREPPLPGDPPDSGKLVFVKIGARNLLTGSVELVRDLPRNFAGAVFVDFGNAFNSFSDPLEYSVGIGVRFRLPIVSVGIDIAQALSTPPGNDRRPGPRVHINFSPKL